jgi:hypothetical protein
MSPMIIKRTRTTNPPLIGGHPCENPSLHSKLCLVIPRLSQSMEVSISVPDESEVGDNMHHNYNIIEHICDVKQQKDVLSG